MTMMKENRDRFLKIWKIEHLCKRLCIDLTDIQNLIEHKEQNYKQIILNTNGKERILHSPKYGLKAVQISISRLLSQLALPNHLTAYTKGNSNITNARMHVGNGTILCFDLKDFFPSISTDRVRETIKRKKCNDEVAELIAELATFRNMLPQGAPSSPVISNLVLENLAFRIYNLTKTHNGTYSQYADDGTLSGVPYVKRLIPTIRRIVTEEGFILHDGAEKLRVITNRQEQLVTGVRIDNSLDVGSEKLMKYQSELREIEADLRSGKLPTKSQRVQSMLGKIGYVKQLNPGTAKQMICVLTKACNITTNP